MAAYNTTCALIARMAQDMTGMLIGWRDACVLPYLAGLNASTLSVCMHAW